MIHMENLTVATTGRGLYEITSEVARVVRASGMETALVHVFVHHTSASLVLCENADPSVQRDVEAWLARAVRDGDPLYTHRAEGEDDMPAHLRSILTTNAVGVPVRGGRPVLGTWQGIFLYEHRRTGHRRRLTVTVVA